MSAVSPQATTARNRAAASIAEAWPRVCVAGAGAAATSLMPASTLRVVASPCWGCSWRRRCSALVEGSVWPGVGQLWHGCLAWLQLTFRTWCLQFRPTSGRRFFAPLPCSFPSRWVSRRHACHVASPLTTPKHSRRRASHWQSFMPSAGANHSASRRAKPLEEPCCALDGASHAATRSAAVTAEPVSRNRSLGQTVTTTTGQSCRQQKRFRVPSECFASLGPAARVGQRSFNGHFTWLC
mmetsp:Transcript_16943/g.64222  ORF Transcript_16943/g.64222 Transcript_16943/m.64222 type:complete len:239 (+) Transcript_16943:802-1518(+)